MPLLSYVPWDKVHQAATSLGLSLSPLGGPDLHRVWARLEWRLAEIRASAIQPSQPKRDRTKEGVLLAESPNGRLMLRKIEDKHRPYVVIDRQTGMLVYGHDTKKHALAGMYRMVPQYPTPGELEEQEAGEKHRRENADAAHKAALDWSRKVTAGEIVRGPIDNGIQIWYTREEAKERGWGQEYRYGAINRPPGLGATPKGMLRVEPPIPGQPFTRHGVVVYPFPLSAKEVYDFELAPYYPLSEVVANALATPALVSYGKEYADLLRGGDPPTDVFRGVLDGNFPFYTDTDKAGIETAVAAALLGAYPPPPP